MDVTRERVLELIARGLDSGQLHALPGSLSRFEWDASGDCHSPVPVQLVGRSLHGFVGGAWPSKPNVPFPECPSSPDEWRRIWQDWCSAPDPRAPWLLDRRHGNSTGFRQYDWRPGVPGMIELTMFVRCRKCEACLEQRRRLWTARALAEVKHSVRTWFLTWTLSPEFHYEMQCRASCRLLRACADFNSLSSDRQFAERHREIGAELTLYLKRVRKESGARLRYLIVAEAHASGLPHYHGLIHEIDNEGVKYRTLCNQWPLGFSMAKLLRTEEAASYVCKYLSKACKARVRASLHYGQTELDDLIIAKRETLPPLKPAKAQF